LKLSDIIVERINYNIFETKNLEKKIVLQIVYSVLLITIQNFLQYTEHSLSKKYYIIELID